MSAENAQSRQPGRLTLVHSGRYLVTGLDGEEYAVEKDYGVGTTERGWSAFRKVGHTRWVGTAWSGETLREVARQMRAAGVLGD